MKASYLLPLLTVFALASCSTFSWPKVVEQCAPAPQPVLEAVFTILSGTGPVDAELEALARRYGAEIVLCTVQELVKQMSHARTPSVAAQRGREFLARVGTKLPSH